MMVRTRRAKAMAASRALEPVEEGSSGDDSEISSRRARPVSTTSKAAKALAAGANKNKRGAVESLYPETRISKRLKLQDDSGSPHEDDEDDVGTNTLSVINAFNPARSQVSRSTLEVVLGTSSRQKFRKRSSSLVEETPQPTRRATISVEREVSREAGDRGYDLLDRAQGSPELDSSVTKPQQTTRLVDPYQVPVSEAPTSLRIRKTVNGLAPASAAARPEKPIRLVPERQPAHVSSLSVGREDNDIRSTVELEDDYEDGSDQSEEESIEEAELEDGYEDDSDESEDESIEEGLIKAPEIVNFRQPLKISNQTLREMRSTIGTAAWANRGDRWEDCFNVGVEPTAITNIGIACSRSVHRLQSILRGIRKAADIWAQHAVLCSQKGRLDLAMAAVNKSIQNVHQSILAHDDKDLEDDITRFIIPRLVVTLSAAFFLGAVGSEHRTELYLKVGTFTNFTVQYLTWITAWIAQLVRALQTRSDQTDVDLATHEEVKAMKALEQFHGLVQEWKQELKNAIDPLNDRIDKLEKAARDEAIKAERRAKEKERIVETHHQWDVVGRDIEERIKRQPNPLAEKWIKSTQGMNLLPSSSASSASAARNYSSAINPIRRPAQNAMPSNISRTVSSSPPRSRPGLIPPYLSSPARVPDGDLQEEAEEDDDDEEFPELNAPNGHGKGNAKGVRHVEEEDEDEDDEDDAFDNTWSKDDLDFLLQRLREVQEKGIRVTNSMLDDWAETLEVTRQDIWVQKSRFENKGLLLIRK
ncbi:hypothetical protein QBC43DRAFT_320642 [Cladorrhinum sp. PSN259]|nr:hypothetical protein QBC43DRAFT_320642 [Cladorrhinum sp. PSN259]